MMTAIPSSLRPLSDPANTPEGLTVRDDGVVTIFARDVGGVEIALSVLDAARVAAALGAFAVRHAGLDGAPAGGEG